jgi:hypothetical protein
MRCTRKARQQSSVIATRWHPPQHGDVTAQAQTNSYGTQMGFSMPKLSEPRQRRFGDARDSLYSARRRRVLDVRSPGHTEAVVRRWDTNTDKPATPTVSYTTVVGEPESLHTLGAHAREVRDFGQTMCLRLALFSSLFLVLF